MPYSNERYNRYRHSPNIITPPSEIPGIDQIEEVAPVEEVRPIYGYTSLTERQNMYNRARQNEQTKTFLSNYNDPTELNSYIDALVNREAVSKRFGEVWGSISTVSGTVSVLAFAGSIIAAALAPVTGGASLAVAAPLAKIGAVAAIPSIPAAVDVTVEKSIKPILAGKPQEAMLNTMMNIGETMDFVANPVKGLVIEGPEGFIKGMGLGSSGRVNYDYDTGFFLTDMLLETVSDPLNWVDFGASLGIKSATKTVAQEATQSMINSTVDTVNRTLAKSVGEITTEGTERISKQVTNATARVAREWAEASADSFNAEARKLAKRSGVNFYDVLSTAEKNQWRQAAQTRLLNEGRGKIQRSLVQALRKELPDATPSQLEIILKKAGRSNATGRLTRSTINQIQDITFDSLSSNVIKGLSSMQHYSNAFQKFMTKNAMLTSGYGIGVEAAKYGWQELHAWANNLTLNRLRNARVFDNANGLDIKQWQEAKRFWEASYRYVSDLTGDISQRDMNAFYAFANQQFNRDKQLITKIMQNGTEPITKLGQIDDQFTALYNCDFGTYVGYIKKINEMENGVYSTYVTYLENMVGALGSEAFTKPMGASIKTGQSLFNVNTIKAQNIIKDVQEAIKVNDKGFELTDKFYTLKLNNAYVNSLIINDPVIDDVLSIINGDENIGALLDKIGNQDLNALAPEVAAQIPIAARIIKEAGASFANIKNLYNEIANIPTDKRVGNISADDFKRYVIDQIFGEDKTVSELLAEFDSITMPSLRNGLETMLQQEGFRFADYPALESQVAEVYRRFLQAQQDAGVEMVGATIVDDFTRSIDDLVKYLPEYADDLQELTLANNNIKNILHYTKASNLALLDDIITDKRTIFDVLKLNTRTLTDAGLALKTVAVKENLDLFNLTTDLSGNIVQSANRLGKSLQNLKKGLKQYHVIFDKDTVESIDKMYKEFRKQFLDNPDFTDTLELPAFKYLKNTKDVYEQFAQLAEFNKLHKDNITSKQFKEILKNNSNSTTLYLNILDPSGLMVTDFAWDPMAQSAWIAKKQLNESIINGIDAYKNLSLNSKKITSDFQAMRDLLSANRIDRPKMLQQERYIKATTPINDMLEFLEQYYNNLFDNELATQEIESLRNVLINFPELSDRYTELVDTLEAYWRGEKRFQQSPKSMRGQEDFIDEFTPFWEQIKEMNADIQKTVNDYNERVAHGLEESTTQIAYKTITPWDPIRKQQELNKLINQATDANAKGAFYNLFSLSPEEFKTELAYRKRFITFEESDIADSQLKAMFNKFKKTLPEGVHLVHDTDTHRYWFVLDKSQRVNMAGRQVYLNDNPIMRSQKKKQFNEFELVDKAITDKNNPGITKVLNQLDDSLEMLTGSRLGDSQGEYLSKEAMQKIYKDYMPQEVKDLLPEIDEWTDKQFFDAYIFNESVLGSANSKTNLGMYSSNMVINTRNAITQAQGYLKPKNEYANSVFDSQLSISSPNSIWESFSDNDLLEALQMNPDYKLVVLADDKKYGMKVREILPTSIDAIKKAKELGGWIIPLQTYKDMYNVVNHRLGSTGMAKLWARIIYVYKFGYLMRPGAWIRNWIDTNLKSKLEMGEDYRSYMDQAHKILEDVNNMKDFVKARDHEGVLKSDAIRQYFEDGLAKYLTYEQYLELDRDFLSQSISGNIMRDLYAGEGGDMWHTITEYTGKIVDMGNKTEEYNRLATYLFELDQGLDYTSALAKVAHTHFDYGFKTKAEQLADMIFPFTTFSLRNYSYWIEALEKHPWLMRNYVHLMKPHWDFKDYTPEELARDYRVQNQILYGQLKLAEFNNKVITFKANPSIQDAIQMFSDPINNVYEKLAAPISYPIDRALGEYTNELNLIPAAGPAIQAAQQMARTGSPIPSAIGVQQAPRQTGKAARIKFSNPNLSGTDEYTDNTYRTPRYRNNIVYDSYSVKGIKQYRVNLYPVVDIAHEVRMRYSTNVYNRIKNRIKTDMYQGIRYRIRLDTNRFR